MGQYYFIIYFDLIFNTDWEQQVQVQDRNINEVEFFTPNW